MCAESAARLSMFPVSLGDRCVAVGASWSSFSTLRSRCTHLLLNIKTQHARRSAALVLTNMSAFVGRPHAQFVFLNFHLLGNGRKLDSCAKRSFLFAGGGTVTWCRDSEVILQVFLQPLTSDLQTPSDWLIKYSAVRRRAGKGCL